MIAEVKLVHSMHGFILTIHNLPKELQNGNTILNGHIPNLYGSSTKEQLINHQGR